ncbi:hypothetical protein [Luteolibacter soli]|uniref:Uncharacterized protein n=1 Tax=Luteolibacter soli TaxID=3135280 RepID=A0ABU9AXW0_9BACT
MQPKSRVLCGKCLMPLTDWLDPVPAGFVVNWGDYEENIIPPSHYWIADDDMNRVAGHVVIHLDDRRGMHPHPDGLRFTGCCGPSGDAVNQLCECGAEVATEVSDCWTGHYAHFQPDTTILESKESSPHT